MNLACKQCNNVEVKIKRRQHHADSIIPQKWDHYIPIKYTYLQNINIKQAKFNNCKTILVYETYFQLFSHFLIQNNF